jgi:hypothetical protein
VAVVVLFSTFKYAIITITLAGTSVIIFTLLAIFGGFTGQLLVGPVRAAIQAHFCGCSSLWRWSWQDCGPDHRQPAV